jgi:hypothetical protein
MTAKQRALLLEIESAGLGWHSIRPEWQGPTLAALVRVGFIVHDGGVLERGHVAITDAGDHALNKCEFGGCKNRAVWSARKLWGKGGTLRTCDDHKPGSRERPASMQHLPSFYDITPIEGR